MRVNTIFTVPVRFLLFPTVSCCFLLFLAVFTLFVYLNGERTGAWLTAGVPARSYPMCTLANASCLTPFGLSENDAGN